MLLYASFLPSNDIVSSAISFMLTISSEPRLIGSWQSELHRRTMPSTQSSTSIKDRVCRPSPHISNVSSEQSVLRQNAAGAFSRPPCHVPKGPYTLWNRAMYVLLLKSLPYASTSSSVTSFSRPYVSCGLAGHAMDS